MPTVRINKDLKERCYFVTFTIIDWLEIFASKKYFEMVVNVLKFYQRKLNLKIFGYVIMKNHIHLIVQCKDMVCFIRSFKSYTTKKIVCLLKKDSEEEILKLIAAYNHRKGKKFQIWKPNNWPKICEEEDYFEQKLNYIHENPVVKQYVERPEDWIYSSARNYYKNDHSVIKVDTKCDID
jgi:REP element-mobilizing transposase RayT